MYSNEYVRNIITSNIGHSSRNEKTGKGILGSMENSKGERTKMTEGIIQKVFNKYHKHYFRVNYSNIDYEMVMKSIEKELIAEIKKADIHFTIKGSGLEAEVANCILLEDLIGDSNE